MAALARVHSRIAALFGVSLNTARPHRDTFRQPVCPLIKSSTYRFSPKDVTHALLTLEVRGGHRQGTDTFATQVVGKNSKYATQE